MKTSRADSKDPPASACRLIGALGFGSIETGPPARDLFALHRVIRGGFGDGCGRSCLPKPDGNPRIWLFDRPGRHDGQDWHQGSPANWARPTEQSSVRPEPSRPYLCWLGTWADFRSAAGPPPRQTPRALRRYCEAWNRHPRRQDWAPNRSIERVPLARHPTGKEKT